MARISYNGSGFLTFYQQLATSNPCYQQNNNRLKTTHLILHSTGANNPNLKRYVTPDDGMLGENKYNNGWNNPKSSTLVHGVIGKNKNGFVEAYQIAPWGKLVWGCGSGLNGSGNSFAIQVEMCEDDTLGANYAKETYNVAVKLFAHLCKSYDIPVENIWSHNEANAKGYASGHVDPEHWWKKVKSGLTMDGFRKDVAALLGGEKTKEQLPAEGSASLFRVQVGAFTLKKNSEYKLQALKSAGYDAFVTQVNGWWKVQVGAYKKRENAEKQVAKLEKDGFSAIIVKVK
jgi:N-acetylmuramoyl-L-alanine amidase